VRKGVGVLILVLVGMTITVFVAALAFGDPFRNADELKRIAVRLQIRELTIALRAYDLNVGSFSSPERGIEALRVKPENVSQWAGPYLTKDIPLDPWGRPYLYKYPGEHGDEPDIISLGADGEPGGEGNNADVVSWSNK
jgi:general secretion pathway protein G